MIYELSDSIFIDATPAQVYDVVSDVTRTGEWSQQCYRCEWEDGDEHDAGEHGVGATFIGHNRTPEREWTTTSEVVIAEPGRHFAWEVIGARVRWGYTMEPEGEGCVLTQYTVFDRGAEKNFAERFGSDSERQIGIRKAAAESGIPETLRAIRDVVQGAK